MPNHVLFTRFHTRGTQSSCSTTTKDSCKDLNICDKTYGYDSLIVANNTIFAGEAQLLWQMIDIRHSCQTCILTATLCSREAGTLQSKSPTLTKPMMPCIPPLMGIDLHLARYKPNRG